MTPDRCDICIIGAACAAARHGASVLLIEAHNGLGGTSTWAGVNNHEPVAGATALPQEVYERLRRRPLAVCLQRRADSYMLEYPFDRLSGRHARSGATGGSEIVDRARSAHRVGDQSVTPALRIQ